MKFYINRLAVLLPRRKHQKFQNVSLSFSEFFENECFSLGEIKVHNFQLRLAYDISNGDSFYWFKTIRDEVRALFPIRFDDILALLWGS